MAGGRTGVVMGNVVPDVRRVQPLPVGGGDARGIGLSWEGDGCDGRRGTGSRVERTVCEEEGREE